MRKIGWLLAVLCGLWLCSQGQPVGAAIHEGYDPVQGGVYLEPPAEMWMPIGAPEKNYANGIVEESFIPFAYASKLSTVAVNLKRSTYSVEVFDLDAQQWLTGLQSWNTSPWQGMGINITPNHVGNFRVEMTLQHPDLASPLKREILVHVSQSNLHAQLVDTQRPRLSHLPAVVEIPGDDGVGIAQLTGASAQAVSTDNSLQWPAGNPLGYAIPGTVVNLTKSIELTATTRTLTTVVNGQTLPVTVTFGLRDITVTEGQKLPLDAEYIQPRPGTKLQFLWHYQAPGAAAQAAPLSDAPEIAIPEKWHQDGKVWLDLIYTYAGQSYTIRTNQVNYHYQPLPAMPVQQATTTVTALLTHDVRFPAALPDLGTSTAQTLEVATTPFMSAGGDVLPAILELPSGERVAAGQTQRWPFSREQIAALTQAQWLLQKQVQVRAGVYRSTIRFTAIVGP